MPPRKKAHKTTDARPTLDDKGRDALKASLTKASDAILAKEDTRDHAQYVDRAVAFIELGAYEKARGSLREAIDVMSKPPCAHPAALKTIEEVLRELPATDAVFEIEKEEDEDVLARFDQEPHATECTATLSVPAETKTSDVTVVIKRDFISVKVRGHSKQPHVIYGCLYGNVEADACAWTLEGAGDSRALVVNLEKETDHPCWPKLLGDPVNYWEDSQNLEFDAKVKISDDDTTSPVWATPEEAAAAAAA